MLCTHRSQVRTRQPLQGLIESVPHPPLFVSSKHCLVAFTPSFLSFQPSPHLSIPSSPFHFSTLPPLHTTTHTHTHTNKWPRHREELHHVTGHAQRQSISYLCHTFLEQLIKEVSQWSPERSIYWRTRQKQWQSSPHGFMSGSYSLIPRLYAHTHTHTLKFHVWGL